MIFQHTHEWITGVSPHTGEPKTQTRRLVKAGEVLHPESWFNTMKLPVAVLLEDGGRHWHLARTVYQVGNTYAVQPGRGKRSIARIEITDIRREDVRDISHEDALAEGFRSRLDFLATWVRMHDKDVFFCHPYIETGSGYARDENGKLLHESYWHLHAHGLPEGKRRKQLMHLNHDATDGDVLDFLRTRPNERYQAWVLDFVLTERVLAEVDAA